MLPIGTETFRIFVDEAEDGVIRGRVSGGTFPEETLFRSLSRLILLLEEQLDTGGAPKASPIKCTETPTFELDILFRQNYSWQGRLRWTKGGKEAAFRSGWSCSSKWKRFWHSNTHQFRNPYLL